MSADWEAAYRASRYAFPWHGRWREFSLDGDEPRMADLDRSVTLITAWNPGSEEKPRAWNVAANARLLRALVARQVPWEPAWGGSLPGVQPAWKEDGFAAFGWTRAEALRWGREYGQRALVWLDAETAGLLFCADGRFAPCGLRRFV
ncbi:MAG: DUF3293 domain-containing protein [Planctomycetota bacterium]|nr:MAG: DUF3293 domain-containing protein [Planctomycetota bacterium]